jgi:hypothetical protein
MATRDDHGDVVCLGGPTEFLYACLNSGQEFIYRRVPIFSDKLGAAHFAILFRLSIRCSVIPSVQSPGDPWVHPSSSMGLSHF